MHTCVWTCENVMCKNSIKMFCDHFRCQRGKLDYAQNDTRKFVKEFLELKIESENDIKISSLLHPMELKLISI